MHHVVEDKFTDGSNAIGIGKVVEIERAAEKVVTAVGHIELRWRGGIAGDFVENAVDMNGVVLVAGLHDGIRLHRMLVGKVATLFRNDGKGVAVDMHIAAMDTGVPLGIVNVDPIFVVAIGGYLSILRHLEGDGENGVGLNGLIGGLGEVDAEIGKRTWRGSPSATGKHREGQKHYGKQQDDVILPHVYFRLGWFCL